jgi:O-antigen/teichoic acid export membrane protein
MRAYNALCIIEKKEMINVQGKVISRIVKGTAAAGLEQVLNIIIQFISVPLFLYYWGISLYGEWILLFTIPSYLAISDLGFAKAAVNSMTLSCADSNYSDANRYYHTCFVLLSFLGLITLLTIAACLFYIPSIYNKLNIEILSFYDVSIIIIVLASYMLLFQHAELLRGIVSASGKFYYSMALVGVYRFIEFCAIAVLLVLGAGPIYVAAVYVCFQVVMIVHLIIYINLSFKWPSLGFKATIIYTSWITMKQMLQPALAFVMLPLGFALRTQIPIFFISVFFSPATIVIYTIARTITSAGSQIIGAINKATTPEYAFAFGSGNLKLVKSIHHNSCNLALGLSALLFILLFSFGELFIEIWTHGRVPFDFILFITFLASLMLNSLWSTSSYLSYSINQHIQQSFFFLIASILGSIITYMILSYSDFSYAAMGIVIADLIMVVYVLKKNRRFLEEDISEFLNNVFRLPSINSIKNIG